jgi:hypothetical protein
VWQDACHKQSAQQAMLTERQTLTLHGRCSLPFCKLDNWISAWDKKMDAPLFELYILFFTLGECEES